MPTKKSSTNRTKARAEEVVSDGTAVRDRVRKLSVGAFRDRNLSIRDLPKLVHEVLEGAVEGVDRSIPKAKGNVLREVFDGLREGVHTIASAGSATVSGATGHAKTVAGKNLPQAAKRVRAANDEFLGAVKTFASKTSRQTGEELNALVARAKQTAPKVAGSAKKVVTAADGRLMELSGETARAGVRAARGAAGALAMGAGGFFEGLAEAIRPKGQPATGKSKAASARSTKKAPTRKRSTKR